MPLNPISLDTPSRTTMVNSTEESGNGAGAVVGNYGFTDDRASPDKSTMSLTMADSELRCICLCTSGSSYSWTWTSRWIACWLWLWFFGWECCVLVSPVINRRLAGGAIRGYDGQLVPFL
ncbi:hypothetical protein CEXT_232251 [Caerostris extrusa]|uniref:Uncharacterized protein n=1 Tax=Caerostris extrusa TaxID=172846 RepID=A0AAV4QZP8_CAEEX|nr:hypothetical protein CEXT_232251 [Caerostris extrusa]